MQFKIGKGTYLLTVLVKKKNNIPMQFLEISKNIINVKNILFTKLTTMSNITIKS